MSLGEHQQTFRKDAAASLGRITPLPIVDHKTISKENMSKMRGGV